MLFVIVVVDDDVDVVVVDIVVVFVGGGVVVVLCEWVCGRGLLFSCVNTIVSSQAMIRYS